MKKLLSMLVNLLGKPHRIDFDYQDTEGTHHGHCDMPLLFTSNDVVEREMKRYGYTNIHIA